MSNRRSSIENIQQDLDSIITRIINMASSTTTPNREESNSLHRLLDMVSSSLIDQEETQREGRYPMVGLNLSNDFRVLSNRVLSNYYMTPQPSTSDSGSDDNSVNNSDNPNDKLINNHIEDLFTNKYYTHYPEYYHPDARKETFRWWPIGLNQKPKDLADAGFFYKNIADRVTCFSCGIVIGQWEPTDDPWLEHIKWADNCEYLRLMKNVKHSVTSKKEEKATSQLEKPNPVHYIQDKAELKDYDDDESFPFCRYCLKNNCSVALIPCGHVACNHCVFAFEKCPVCRSDIVNKLKIFY